MDNTPKVAIVIDETEYANVKEYQYESNVLQLGDPFQVKLGAPDGDYGLVRFNPGAPAEFWISDPTVAGGGKVRKSNGLVTRLDIASDIGSGTALQVTGADLGWHLANNCAPLWFNMKGATWERFLNACIYPHRIFQGVSDPGWGFSGVRLDNDLNVKKKVNLGRALVQQRLAQQLGDPLQILPPIQIEPGQTIADTLVHYAKLSKCLVNVSHDGYLQVFQPNYNGPALYTLHYHASDEADRKRNNVLSARLSRSIDGLYSQVECLSTITRPPFTENLEDPNRGKKRQSYTPATDARVASLQSSNLDFRRYWTFVDTEQLKDAQILARAKWFADRGEFDSYSLEYTVKGHSMDGYFFEPDTLCEVDDTVLGVRGTFYVCAVRYLRTMQAGTTSMLTLKRKNFLQA